MIKGQKSSRVFTLLNRNPFINVGGLFYSEMFMLTLGGLHVKNAAQRAIWESGKSCDRPTHGFPAFQDNC
jgi:hypothetical protein